MAKVKSYEEQQYNRKADLLPALQQAIEDVKYNRNSAGGWNRLAHDVGGITMRLLPDDKLELSYSRVLVATRADIVRQQGEGYRFVDEISKEFKKAFRENTKKTLKLKKVDEAESVDKISMLTAASSPFGSFMENGRPYGRMLVRSSIVYDFDTVLSNDE